MENEKQCYKCTHRNWIIGILVFLVIFLVGYIAEKRVINNKTLIDFISIVSAILSIALSVIAIFYSYHSMTESDRQGAEVGKSVACIEKINESIRDNNQQLLSTIIMLKEQVTRIEENSKKGKNEPKMKYEKPERAFTPNKPKAAQRTPTS